MEFKRIIANLLGSTTAAYLISSLMLIIMLSPLVFTLFTSFKTLDEVFIWPPTVFPEKPTLEAYHEVIFRSPMPSHIINSLIITLATTGIVVGASMFAAYGLSQFKYKGSRLVLLSFLGTRVIPPISLVVPFYIVFSYFRLINTYTVLIIINTFLCYPLAIWMFKSFLDSFPRELIDAATIDGCSRTGAYFRVVLPVVAVGIGAVAIITFLWTWNEFLFGMLFTNTRDVQPLTVGAHYFIGDEFVQWNSVAATGMFTTVPGIIFFLTAQRAIVKGLTQGAIKG